MKLSRLYSNKDAEFSPVTFGDGLNVVLAEIRLPENRNKDTHNLGKTTLGLLIDYCLLARRDNGLFLFRHAEIFDDYVFYLELKLPTGQFLTIRREVAENTKISLKTLDVGNQDLNDLSDEEWDHFRVPIGRAKTIVQGILNLTALQHWSFRKVLGYLLRTQDDYGDVFQLRRFASSHKDWKPFLAHILGFDAKVIADYYEKEEEIDALKRTEATIASELGGGLEDLSKIEGILLLKQKQAERLQAQLDSFDFRSQDRERTKDLVDAVDAQIATLNSERYSLSYNRRKIETALREDQLIFSPSEAAKLFAEAGVLFAGQIKRDFEELLAFNRAITEERSSYLLEEKGEIDSRLKEVGAELTRLGKRRSDTLAFLSDTDVVRKYKKASESLIEVRSDILALTRQRTHLQRLQQLRAEIRTAVEELAHLEVALENEFKDKNKSDATNLYSSIRVLFDGIIEDVLDQSALLTVSLNHRHHPEFDAEFLDSSGSSTSAVACPR